MPAASLVFLSNSYRGPQRISTYGIEKCLRAGDDPQVVAVLGKVFLIGNRSLVIAAKSVHQGAAHTVTRNRSLIQTISVGVIKHIRVVSGPGYVRAVDRGKLAGANHNSP